MNKNNTGRKGLFLFKIIVYHQRSQGRKLVEAMGESKEFVPSNLSLVRFLMQPTTTFPGLCHSQESGASHINQ